MSDIHNYLFNNMGRIGSDQVDNTQRTLTNVRFANYMLSSFDGSITSDTHVKFAVENPTVNFSGIAHGSGLNGSVVDIDSFLMLKKDNERPLERLQLMQRPFLTVPYLGRGSGNPDIESQLQQGELVSDRKSVNTIMENNFSGYSLYPQDQTMVDHMKNYQVEDTAMNGWVRGGASTRDLSVDDKFKQSHRPNDSSF